MSAVDLELKKAFAELQSKHNATKEAISDYERNIDLHTRLKRIATITNFEIQKLNEQVNMYETVGRCFIKVPRKEVVEHLDQKIEEYGQILKQESDKIKLAETKLKEAENSLRELVQFKKSSA